ncbi:hypothetical protein PTSG_01466 [Salpingoeca rosetta]|uniref:Uncharacterized protein n=1 Tax=Salpingoeca rosetta (strain ATCC 50818 / BSB-021) TaxID=946362 RepID=F2U0F2_SALR5|nr:uncharacterized protein PTSG_01466 [Salpingoeca rosetta]EGD80880.1 hypothetical protein PTSG_01466 [Salpingoeca rosetta]|eukprot:XP_004997441.1 hypothetical protein PTSG_01466 [Salpingoeca rosetta]
MGRRKQRGRSGGSTNKKKGSRKQAIDTDEDFQRRDVYNADAIDFSKVKPVDEGDSDQEYAVGSGEDEDIDSDAALDSEDEQMFEDIMQGKKPAKAAARKQSKKASLRPQLDLLDEDDDNMAMHADNAASEDDDDDADDYMDLSEMLTRGDGDDKPAKEGGEAAAGGVPADADDDDDDDDGDALDDDEAQEKYQQVVDGFLNMSKTLVDRHERTEAEAPSMANVTGTAATDKVSLTDLLGTLGDGGAKIGRLKQALAPLSAKQSTMKLDTPLGRAAKEKIARQTAFTQAAENVSRWEPIVRENRRADFVSFAGDPTAKRLMSTVAALATKFKPKYDVEKQIEQALQASKAVESQKKALTEGESLALKALSPKEAEARVRELARIRALNSYYEAKCRRIKKIKSKKYRKIRRKAAQRLDDESLEELDEDERKQRLLKQERKRAEERLTLKHKNKGKWAKRMMARGSMDVDTRRALNEQQQLSQQLLKKATMQESDDEQGGDYDMNSDFDEEEETVEDAVAGLEEELRAAPAKQTATGIEGMKFMQQAVQRQREEAEQMLRELKAELAGGAAETDDVSTAHRMKLGPSSSGKTARARKNKADAAAAAATAKEKRASKKGGADDSDDDDDNDGVGGGVRDGAVASDSDSASDDENADSSAVVGGGDDSAAPRFRGKRTVRARGAVEVKIGASGEDVGDMQVTSVETHAEAVHGGLGGTTTSTSQKKQARASDTQQGGATKSTGGPSAKNQQQQKGKAGQGQQKQNKKQEKKQAAAGTTTKEKQSTKKAKQGDDATATKSSSGAAAKSKAKAKAKEAAPTDAGETNLFLAAMSRKPEDNSSKRKGKKGKKGKAGAANTDAENPWIQAAAGNNAGLTPQMVITDKSTASEKRMAKLQMLRSKAHKNNGAPQLKDLEAAVTNTTAKQAELDAIKNDVLDEDEATADATQGHTRLDLTKSNKELIAQAFASDDVLAQEFEKEKAAIADAETPKDKVTLMPGWGEWAGVGMKSSTKVKRIVKKAPPAKKRRDAQHKTVIITEKANKRLQEKKIAAIPHPFVNPAHFEQVMQAPVGREWNTVRVFQKSVRPAVETKAGMYIEPMKMTKGAIAEATRKFEEKTGGDSNSNSNSNSKNNKNGKNSKNNTAVSATGKGKRGAGGNQRPQKRAKKGGASKSHKQ